MPILSYEIEDYLPCHTMTKMTSLPALTMTFHHYSDLLSDQLGPVLLVFIPTRYELKLEIKDWYTMILTHECMALPPMECEKSMQEA